MARTALIPVFAGAIAVAVGLGASAPARAATLIWDGTIAFTALTPQCAPIGIDTDTTDALYRPHLTAGDPNAAVIVHDSNQGHLVQVQAATTTPQMNGTGLSYDGSFYVPSTGLTQTWTGTYSFTVTPATVTAATTFVKITGTIENFANIAGCTLTIKGGFLRRL